MNRSKDDEVGSGQAPAGVGLLIVDMINDMQFEDASKMQGRAIAAAETILRLRDQADSLGTPVIYVNDNYGEWRSERSQIIAHCRENGGGELVRRIAPRADDYFVIKPQVSGFYATNLPVLLPQLGVNRVVLSGIAADICVLFTAADAHMRSYDLWIPSDAVASTEVAHSEWALQIMRKSMDAEVRATTQLTLEEWAFSQAQS